jgi:hypothetical protein
MGHHQRRAIGAGTRAFVEKLSEGVSEFEIVRRGLCLKRADLVGGSLLSFVTHLVDNLASVERIFSGG